MSLRDRLRAGTWRSLVELGWPVSVTLLMRVTMRTVDIIAVGVTVGAVGVAALGVGDTVARIVLQTTLGLAAGVVATVSQRLGAGDDDGADVAVTQSMVLALMLGIPIAVAGWYTAPFFYDVLGASPAVTDVGVIYLRIVILSAPARTLAIMLTRALYAAGDTRAALAVRSVGISTNILTTVLLVPGLVGLPQLGVVGAAVGTALGNAASAVLLIGMLVSARRPIRLAAHGLWAPATMRRIVRIGTPQVGERNVYALSDLPLNAIVLAFGTEAHAGFHIGRRLLLYALLPTRGIATAASTYMGMHVGAGEVATGERYGRGAISLAALVSMAISLPMFVLASPLAALFVQEPGAAELAATWIRVYAIITTARTVFAVLRSAMQGAGETRAPFWATTLGVSIFALGFSWLVGIRLGFGLWAVYVGIGLDFLLRAVLLKHWFDDGLWHRSLPAAERLGAVG